MKSIMHKFRFTQSIFDVVTSEKSCVRPWNSTISRKYCDNKSIYQRNEEEAHSKPERKVYGQPYPEWRKPWIKRDGEWSSKLNIFVEKNPSPYVMNALHKLPDVKWHQVREWWADMKVIQEIQNQKYLPERVAVLGPNLAALHFFTHRQATVRLKDKREWYSGDIFTLNLPTKYEDGYFVEAVNCTKFHHGGIRYEGIANLSSLHFLKWLSLKDIKHIDVWCLDRLAGQNGSSLEYLDISGCQLCTGGVFALARMPALQVLVITDPGDNVPVQAALSMLEMERPDLMIRTEEKFYSSDDPQLKVITV